MGTYIDWSSFNGRLQQKGGWTNHHNQQQLQFCFIHTRVVEILVIVLDDGVGILNHNLSFV